MHISSGLPSQCLCKAARKDKFLARGLFWKSVLWKEIKDVSSTLKEDICRFLGVASNSLETLRSAWMPWDRILLRLLSYSVILWACTIQGWCHSNQGKHALMVRLCMLQHLGSKSYLRPRIKLGFCLFSTVLPASPLRQQPFLLQPSGCCRQCQASNRQVLWMWELALWQHGNTMTNCWFLFIPQPVSTPQESTDIQACVCWHILVLLSSYLQVEQSGSLWWCVVDTKVVSWLNSHF